MTSPPTPPTPQSPAPPPQSGVPQGAPGGPVPGDTGWQGAADRPTYTSPIPVRRTHLGHALLSEWTKIRTVRSTLWTLAIFVVLVIGIGLLFTVQADEADFANNTPYTVPAFFGLLLGQVCLITLGVLVISSEYATGMIRTTFTASPQRSRVLAAKILVFFAVAYVVSAVSISVVGLVASSVHSGVSDAPWQGTVFKGALYVSLLGVLSLALGSILRHSAGAITTMLGLVLVPAILPAFLLMSESTAEIGRKMAEYNAPSSLATIFEVDNGSGHGAAQMWLLVVITAVAVGAAFALLERRDV